MLLVTLGATLLGKILTGNEVKKLVKKQLKKLKKDSIFNTVSSFD